jgi:uncharacterized protein (TIGR02266 family)
MHHAPAEQARGVDPERMCRLCDELATLNTRFSECGQLDPNELKRWEALRKELVQLRGLLGPRRKFARVNTRLMVAFQTGAAFAKAWADSLGGGGLSIQTDRPLAVNDRLRLRLTIPGLPAPLDVETRVAWCSQEGRAGLEFESIDAETRRRVEVFVLETLLRLERSSGNIAS